MNSYIIILLIAISLSMDAFSLSLAFGMQGIEHKKKLFMSIIVGIYHFIMPLIGVYFGSFIIKNIPLNINVISSIILIFIGLELIISGFKKDDNKLTTSISGILLFGLTVSLDALSVGIGLSAINNIYIIDALTFSICAFIFTFTGLEIGNIINNKIGEYSKLLGGIVLTLLGIIIYFN